MNSLPARSITEKGIKKYASASTSSVISFEMEMIKSARRSSEAKKSRTAASLRKAAGLGGQAGRPTPAASATRLGIAARESITKWSIGNRRDSPEHSQRRPGKGEGGRSQLQPRRKTP